jgi:AcrR family transcriptional regulator
MFVFQTLQKEAPMTPEEKNIREQIINATIELIEEKGLSQVTVRAIARAARVNIAAINYYFGSKEKLLDAVLLFTLDNAFSDPLAELSSGSLSSGETLRLVLSDWLQGTVNYPGITRAHVLGHHLAKRQHSRSIDRLNGFLKALATRLQELQPEADPDAVRILIVQKISAVILPAMLPELFHGFLGLDLTTPGGRTTYLDQLLNIPRQNA